MLMATQHTATPTLSVRDNRGLRVRMLSYNRRDASQAAVALIERQLASEDGRHTRQWDARLFGLWQSDNNVSPNLHARPSLAGQVLRSDSVDAGWHVALYDAAGRVVWGEDGRGTRSRNEFDQLGRPQAAYLQANGEAERVVERFIYGDTDSNTADPAGHNVRGQLVRHYHDAGLQAQPSYSLQGGALREQCQLLRSAQALSDWQGGNESAWQDKLAPEVYTTTHEYDALGGMLTQTDTRGNRQRWSFDVAGLLSQAYLTLVGSSEQMLLKQQRWSAAGQKLAETAGNDVVTNYSYEPQTQRLVRIKTLRANQTVLQDLSYGYDPVGNVLWQDNAAVTTRYFDNQAVKARQDYQYDALYQLISASGRENANAGQQGPSLPAVLPDTNNLVNYTRSYEYDGGGNLLRIQHAGAQNYSNEMVVSGRSNRSLAQNSNQPIAPGQVDSYFDANGNVLQMQPGTPLGWDGYNQLRQVVQVNRGGAEQDNDRELYQYRNGQRVRKQARRRLDGVSQRWDVEETVYLPGLELRTRYVELAGQPQAPSEVLAVSTPAQGGRASVRVLHWETGKPATIVNNQVRYGLGNQIGSLLLEFDSNAQVISQEEYYPFGGTAVLAARSEVEVNYKVVRYSGKERDGTGLYYYGYRYYAPWLGRWLNPDPAGLVDGLNVYRMVRNNPVSMHDAVGLNGNKNHDGWSLIVNGDSDGSIPLEASSFAELASNKQPKIFIVGDGHASPPFKYAKDIPDAMESLKNKKLNLYVEFTQDGWKEKIKEYNKSSTSSQDRELPSELMAKRFPFGLKATVVPWEHEVANSAKSMFDIIIDSAGSFSDMPDESRSALSKLAGPFQEEVGKYASGLAKEFGTHIQNLVQPETSESAEHSGGEVMRILSGKWRDEYINKYLANKIAEHAGKSPGETFLISVGDAHLDEVLSPVQHHLENLRQSGRFDFTHKIFINKNSRLGHE